MSCALRDRRARDPEHRAKREGGEENQRRFDNSRSEMLAIRYHEQFFHKEGGLRVDLNSAWLSRSPTAGQQNSHPVA